MGKQLFLNEIEVKAIYLKQIFCLNILLNLNIRIIYIMLNFSIVKMMDVQ